jgi:uncharacterized protein YcnI
MKMSTNFLRAAFFVAIAAGLTAPATAHVRVFAEPGWTRAPACNTTEFVVFVPNERPDATVRVDLAIPQSVRVIATQPVAGWTATFTKVKGRVAGITWSGGHIHPLEYQRFAFLATPTAPQLVSWDALQTYEGGTVVKWTGPPNSDTPHSQIQITQPLKASDCRPSRRP